MKIDLKIPLVYRQKDVEDILEHYKNVTMTVTDLAKKYNVNPRTIQRLVKTHGIVRTIAEANKVTAKLKNYDALRVPDHLKAKRKSLGRKLRLQVLTSQPYCSICNGSRGQGYTLQVDHIDGDASNNILSNLQVLCIECNQGKR